MRNLTIMALIAMLLAVTTGMKAQDEKVEATIGTDVVSQYIWRGQDLGNVSLQPSLTLEYKGFSLSAWGSVGLSQPSDTKEFDLTAAYSVGGFNIGVTDYWFNEGLDPQNRYLQYHAHNTNHVFEVNVGYDFGVAAVQWFTNFAGNDGCNNDGKRAYSSYVEASVPFKFASCDWTAAAGAVPFATDFYDVDKFSVINLSLRATKEIGITEKFGIPVFAEIDVNPDSKKAYFVFGLTISN